MSENRFDVKKLEKLNNPERLEKLPAAYIVEKTGMQNGCVLVDLGAGTGLYSKKFAAIDGSMVYACDISKVMVDYMNDNLVEEYENIIPMRMDDSKVLLKDAFADFVVMINLHHELDHPDKTLKECYRLLKPQGSIVISDWKKELTERGPSLDIRVGSDEIKSQLQETGFSEVEIFEDLQTNYLVVAKK